MRYINEQTIALLEGELDLALANLKSLSRPREVVARHRELTQKALRDEATLVTLQNQLKQFELEQARATSPWELISTPTLLDKPVSPRKRRTLALGLLAGLVMGSGGALASDRRSGRVYSIVELDRFLPGPLLERLPCQGDSPAIDVWKSPIQLLTDGPLRKSSSFALVPVGEIDAAHLEGFTAELRRALGTGHELVVSRDLLATRSASTQVLITAPGAKREELRQLREQLDLQGNQSPAGCCSTPRSKRPTLPKNLSMSRLLITGGAGFIGSHTCVVLLEAGHELLILDNFSNSSPVALDRVQELSGRSLQCIKGDVRDSVLLEQLFADAAASDAPIRAVITSPASKPWANPLPIRCAIGT